MFSERTHYAFFVRAEIVAQNSGFCSPLKVLLLKVQKFWTLARRAEARRGLQSMAEQPEQIV